MSEPTPRLALIDEVTPRRAGVYDGSKGGADALSLCVRIVVGGGGMMSLSAWGIAVEGVIAFWWCRRLEVGDEGKLARIGYWWSRGGGDEDARGGQESESRAERPWEARVRNW